MSDVLGSPTTRQGRPKDRARQCPTMSKAQGFGERVPARDSRTGCHWKLFDAVSRWSFEDVSAGA